MADSTLRTACKDLPQSSHQLCSKQTQTPCSFYYIMLDSCSCLIKESKQWCLLLESLSLSVNLQIIFCGPNSYQCSCNSLRVITHKVLAHEILEPLVFEGLRESSEDPPLLVVFFCVLAPLIDHSKACPHRGHLRRRSFSLPQYGPSYTKVYIAQVGSYKHFSSLTSWIDEIKY